MRKVTGQRIDLDGRCEQSEGLPGKNEDLLFAMAELICTGQTSPASLLAVCAFILWMTCSSDMPLLQYLAETVLVVEGLSCHVARLSKGANM